MSSHTKYEIMEKKCYDGFKYIKPGLILLKTAHLIRLDMLDL